MHVCGVCMEYHAASPIASPRSTDTRGRVGMSKFIMAFELSMKRRKGTRPGSFHRLRNTKRGYINTINEVKKGNKARYIP